MSLARAFGRSLKRSVAYSSTCVCICMVPCVRSECRAYVHWKLLDVSQRGCLASYVPHAHGVYKVRRGKLWSDFWLTGARMPHHHDEIRDLPSERPKPLQSLRCLVPKTSGIKGKKPELRESRKYEKEVGRGKNYPEGKWNPINPCKLTGQPKPEVPRSRRAVV